MEEATFYALGVALVVIALIVSVIGLRSERFPTSRLALLMTLPPLMWAGNAIVGRLMAGQVPPLTLNFLRWVLVLLILLIGRRARR